VCCAKASGGREEITNYHICPAIAPGSLLGLIPVQNFAIMKVEILV
jgi:hypothetical protein